MFDLTGQVHIGWAVGLGLFGLASGIAFGRVSAKDALDRGRRLISLAIKYERRADSAYSLMRALSEPTQAVPTIELIAAASTWRERLRDTAVRAVERGRDALTRTPATPDWQPGEMTRLSAMPTPEERAAEEGTTEIFDMLVAEFSADDTFTTLPAQASPWVPPVAAPALQPSPAAPSRARMRHSETVGLPGRLRTWNGTLLGPVPHLDMPAFPRPFRMPVPTTRLPHDPRRLAMLDPDDTRQFRTKVVSA